MSGVVGTDDLSPFVGRLRDEATAAVRSVLALPADAPLTFRPRDGFVECELRLPGRESLVLELRRATPDARAWYVGPVVAIGYRNLRSGASPLHDPLTSELLGALHRRLQARSADVEHRQAEAAFSQLQEITRWAGLDDDKLRRVSVGFGARFATLRLGFRCNQDCGFCWQDRQWPDVPPEVARAWLDELAAAGVTHVSFTGGEPTLYRHLPELVARANELGLRVEIQTNAIRFGKRAWAEQLRSCGPASLFVSYHAGEAALSDELTRAPHTHGATVRGIQTALELGFIVDLNCVVARSNTPHLLAYADDVLTRFPAVKLVSFTHPCEAFEPDAWHETVVPLEEVAAPLSGAARRLTAAAVTVRVTGQGCAFPPCTFHEAPELIDLQPARAFDRTDEEGRIYALSCEQCAVKPFCLGLRREYVDHFGDEGLRPFSEVPLQARRPEPPAPEPSRDQLGSTDTEREVYNS